MATSPADTTHSWWYSILSIVVGFVLSQATEFLRTYQTRKRDKEERAIIFQRGVLIELQETLITLVRTSAKLHLADVAMDRKSGEKPSKPYDADLQQQLEFCTVKMMALAPRLADTTLRSNLDELQAATKQSEEHGASHDGLLGFIHSTDTFLAVNEELGRLLRELV